jgi:hypothetical protein
MAITGSIDPNIARACDTITRVWTRGSATVTFVTALRTGWIFAAAVASRFSDPMAASDLAQGSGLLVDVPTQASGLLVDVPAQGKGLRADGPVQGSDLRVDVPVQGSGLRVDEVAATL